MFLMTSVVGHREKQVVVLAFYHSTHVNNVFRRINFIQFHETTNNIKEYLILRIFNRR